MNKNIVMVFQACFALLASLLLVKVAAANEIFAGQPEEYASFKKFHRQILMRYCVNCHTHYPGKNWRKIGFAKDPRVAAQVLLEWEYVKPYQYAESYLVKRLKGGWLYQTMPPSWFGKSREADKLVRDEALRLLRRWINAGAPVPEE